MGIQAKPLVEDEETWCLEIVGMPPAAYLGGELESSMEEQAPYLVGQQSAPRVTPAEIEAEIVSEFYFTAADGVLGESQLGTRPAGIAYSLNHLTFCVLVLRNGFTVTGESACASPANFDRDLGRKIARLAAVAKVWPLLGFRLRDKLAVGG